MLNWYRMVSRTQGCWAQAHSERSALVELLAEVGVRREARPLGGGGVHRSLAVKRVLQQGPEGSGLVRASERRDRCIGHVRWNNRVHQSLPTRACVRARVGAWAHAWVRARVCACACMCPMPPPIPLPLRVTRIQTASSLAHACERGTPMRVQHTAGTWQRCAVYSRWISLAMLASPVDGTRPPLLCATARTRSANISHSSSTCTAGVSAPGEPNTKRHSASVSARLATGVDLVDATTNRAILHPHRHSHRRRHRHAHTNVHA